MAAPKPFTLAPPSPATEVPVPTPRAGRAKKDHGPNFFLQPDPEHGFPDGWLAESFKTGLWYDVPPVSGEVVEGVVEKGSNKGKPTTRITGDAKEVTRQLREAAELLEIGVSIKYFPVVYQRGPKAGQEVPGKLLIKYLAQQRKQRRSNDPAIDDGTAAEVTPAE